MKTFIIAIVLSLSTLAATQRPDLCKLPEYIEGSEIRCRANKLMFRFDNVTNMCVMFFYSGCFGTANRFVTLRDCVQICGAENQPFAPNFCSLKPETGRCRGYFESFYYDVSDGKCKKFIYGGCDGNDNRFDTEKECLSSCERFQLK